MASFFIDNFQSVARTLADGETGYVSRDGKLVVDNNHAIAGSGGNIVMVNGEIAVLSNSHFVYDFDGTSTEVFVGPEASVTAALVGFSLQGTSLVRFRNDGAINTDNTAVYTNPTDPGMNVDVVNNGSITGNTGLLLSSGENEMQIANTGVIASQGNAVYIVSQTGEVSFVNTGDVITNGVDTIWESYAAYRGGQNPDLVTNVGRMVGGVELRGGDDLLDTRGGVVVGVIEAGDGDDRVLGSRDGDEVLAGDGADLVRGGHGDDAIAGDLGDDELRGGAGADDIAGNGGSDALFGNDGEDALRGGGASDVIDGGLGDDVLAGGKGGDRFVFRRRADDDRILDFENGIDRIDLTAFGFRPAQFSSEVAPALSSAGPGATFLDLAKLGGSGSVLIEGLNVGDADASDFLL